MVPGKKKERERRKGIIKVDWSLVFQAVVVPQH